MSNDNLDKRDEAWQAAREFFSGPERYLTARDRERIKELAFLLLDWKERGRVEGLEEAATIADRQAKDYGESKIGKQDYLCWDMPYSKVAEIIRARVQGERGGKEDK